IIFTDSEPSDLINNITFPFAGVICTPSCYLKELGDKQVRYDGYHEIAYLHPDYFIPDPSILDQFGTEGKEKNIVLRFISWGASHDIGLAGLKEATNIIDTLESYGNIRITSERKLPPRFEKYRIAIPPEKIHSLLYYSDLYMGEGGTMAVESALLGTPAIHIEGNSEGVAMGNFSGNFLDLRDNYGLLDFYPDQEQALRKAVEILEDEKSKGEWMQKRKKLFNDKIDVTKWMVDFVEQYPESLRGI
ncbi:DUF354 domain-containing protein, partial [Methanocalculus sp.]|uniref:DUF354 domain-containing protein n=1 Tax=Methanocalculus sp. TaxID=2004547 RepID=UPI0026300079